jgi:hypothetical protein
MECFDGSIMGLATDFSPAIDSRYTAPRARLCAGLVDEQISPSVLPEHVHFLPEEAG